MIHESICLSTAPPGNLEYTRREVRDRQAKMGNRCELARQTRYTTSKGSAAATKPKLDNDRPKTVIASKKVP